MKYFVLFAVVAVVVAAVPLEVAEDENGEQYYLVPVSREKRQTKWGVSNTGVGIGHRGTILNNNNHRLDGSAYAQKDFRSHGLRPDQFGGRLDYSHKPSASSAFVSADHVRNYGTDVRAGGQYNFVNRKNFNVGAVASYDRRFGGPFGTGRPQGYVGLTATGRF